eukprot:CAMPEP_0116018654 /NCGR_PEP_ID=MMETSP0321-20121206/8773_1 /TAXON_ID=163516 /ORGANISM="Leptocylindrus danicus var. danicus, Strain B650" /LENGTH=354 /DNA_ID=CAMNT_0003489081 /DNA_START=340 /DNA_END=1404 /DNA_ORIENTATION=-
MKASYKVAFALFAVAAAATVGLFIYGDEVGGWFSTEDEEDDSMDIDRPISNPTMSPIAEDLPYLNYDFIQCPDDLSQPCCNGLSSNCVKRVNEIMFATSHNAMSTQQDFFFAPNHNLNLETSLKAGFRAFMLDLCDCNNRVEFCHSECILGTRDPSTVFAAIVSFLEENLSEVIVLELQIDPGSDMFELYSVMQDVDGFSDMIYEHPDASSDWPFLSQLVDDNKRILIFQHRGPNCQTAGQCPEGFHSTYNFMFETPFSLESKEELLDYTDSCRIQTGQSDADFFILNHFAGSPNSFFPEESTAREVNQIDVLESRTEACASLYDGRIVNFVAVDFWSVGDTAKFVQEYNKALA